ncbi:MAG TPA: DNA replication/repair protein RecF [Bacteroidia bacterium]|jgi:DNA replication and repair protein RecF|nr:DNA replication/repair protein RecF [Bacteroidia bacterium]
MYLKEITLLHFKNYTEAGISFSPKINCFTGANGMGKTNLLDAIHYLSLCKSFSNTVDSQSISFEQPFFMVQGLFDKNGREEEVLVSLRRAQKKVVKRNKNEYEKLAEHIGLFPLVMISPLDTILITGGGGERRRFVDGIISQFDKYYLEKLISYNGILQQRNALLKQFAVSRSFDGALLEIMDEQIAETGNYIHEARVKFLNDFIPVFEKYYRELSGNAEQVQLRYISTLQGAAYLEALKLSLHKDCAVEHTSVGIHRDDLDFLLAGHEVKKYASQGQQKTYLLALKLAQYEYIKNKTGIKPLLLLDDVYDKLDNKRFEKLIALVSSDDFGQVFITDTNTERMRVLFSAQKNSRIYLVENSVLTRMT